MQQFDEHRFRAQVDSAVQHMRTILDNSRSPQQAAEGVSHQYDDKYALAEWLGNTSIRASLECLRHIGASEADLASLASWVSGGRSVSLRFESTETLAYLRETTREVESPAVVTESSLFGKSSTKVVTKITEHFWKFEATWQLCAFVGTGSGAGETLPLLMRKGSCELMSSDKDHPPRVASRIHGPWDVNITWLFASMDTGCQKSSWRIQRALASCRTPRRNDQVQAALSFFRAWFEWFKKVQRYLVGDLAPTQPNHGLDINAVMEVSGIFNPVVPLFENGQRGPPVPEHLRALPDLKAPKLLLPGEGAQQEEKEEKEAAASAGGSVVPAGGAAAAGGSALLPLDDTARLLGEQRRTLEAKRGALAQAFPARESDRLFSRLEATVSSVSVHALSVAQAFSDALDSIESMLRRQLLAAVGKELTPLDFANYMRFHFRKLYRQSFEPSLFSHAIRRPEHVPEGVVSIEATTPSQLAGQNAEPVLTIARKIGYSWPMKFALNAATNVTFAGERYLHAYVSQQFSGQGMPNLTLQARARQFSSFIVLLGSLSGADVFQPKHAILVQNKDELSIPLNLETLPSAGEFRDAIESLSPEQQRFAKAVRAMQLEGSLFGILVLQVKPALEKLLRLPSDSLTKEIELTQDVLRLFQDYQIPSDLLSYEPAFPGAEVSDSTATKLDFVREQVRRMHDLIAAEKERQLEERRQEAAYNIADKLAVNSPPITILTRSVAPLSVHSHSLRVKSKEAPLRSRRSDGAPGASASVSVSTASSSSSPRRELLSSRQQVQLQTQQAPVQMQQQQQQQQQQAQSVVAQPTASSSVAAPQAHETADPVPAEDAEAGRAGAAAVEGEPLNWTAIPAALDAKLLSLDEESALRPTTISAGSVWTRRGQKSLLSPAVTSTLHASEQSREKNQAFDLLDALSRSGSLLIDEGAELHVVLAFTHLFDKSLIDTVVQDNVNPIEKVERSALILATTIHDKQPSELIKPEQRERIATYAARNIFLEEQKHARMLLQAPHHDDAAAAAH
jgi:hypothetical protein